jgi:hypothetical protein
MGFWQGVNEGLTYSLEAKARRQERQQELDLRKQDMDLRKAERAETRAWQLQDQLQERITATLPLIVERDKEVKAKAQERAVLGNYFDTRLADVDEQTRTAFTNLALQAPDWTKNLIETVQSMDDKRGAPITGQDIVSMSNIFEQTKPENMTIEDWTKQAASMVVVDNSGFDREATLAKILSGDLDEKSLLEVQASLLTPTPAGLGILPNFDTSVVIGADPTRRNAIRTSAMEEVSLQYQNDVQSLTAEYDKLIAEGSPIPEELQAAKMQLDRIAGIRDTEGADAAEAAMWNIYAPKVLPAMSQRQPEIKTMFPEYFATAPQRYRWDGSQLVGIQ